MTEFVTQQLLIPGPKCGLIIGKNGETIKSMQESIGVKMLLVQDNQQSGNQPKPLRITGSADKVEQAKRAVELLLANDDVNGRGAGSVSGAGTGANSMLMSQTRSMGEVIVPRSSVGIIIGKQGETIKRLGLESGAKIQFKPDNDTSTPERCAVIQGTLQQIERATNMIWDLVQRSNGNAQQEVCLMHVPANKTGLVIGKGGDTIKSICNETAAHVELSRDPPPNQSEKVFVIRGTPYQIHLAQHLIRIKVGDLPPGTPAPPFQNLSMSGGFQQPYAGSGGQFGAQQQQWQANGFVANQDPTWGNNPYFAGQQQGGYVAGAQPQFAASQAYQQPSAQQSLMQGGGSITQAQSQPTTATSASSGQSAQPSINPTTGQPDYSAQWIAYYRSVGLHDQANLIEQQMKGTAQSGSA